MYEILHLKTIIITLSFKLSSQRNWVILARYIQAQLKLLPRISYCTYRGNSGRCKWQHKPFTMHAKIIIIIIIMVIFKSCFSGELIALSYIKNQQQQRCEHRIRKNKQIKSTVHDGNKKYKINKLCVSKQRQSMKIKGIFRNQLQKKEALYKQTALVMAANSIK